MNAPRGSEPTCPKYGRTPAANREGTVRSPTFAAVDTASPTAPPLENLLAQIRAGDSDACGQLYEVTSRGVRLVFRHHLGHDAPERLVQDAYLDLFEGIRNGVIAAPDSLGAFLRDIVRAHARRAGQESGAAPVHQMAAREQAGSMQAALGQLPPADRQLLRRYIVEGEPAARVCAEAGVSPEHLRRALATVRRLFHNGLRRGHTPSHATAAGA